MNSKDEVFRGEDLIRLAELIKLSAETARAFALFASPEAASRITAAADQIGAAANDLKITAHL